MKSDVVTGGARMTPPKNALYPQRQCYAQRPSVDASQRFAAGRNECEPSGRYLKRYNVALNAGACSQFIQTKFVENDASRISEWPSPTTACRMVGTISFLEVFDGCYDQKQKELDEDWCADAG